MTTGASEGGPNRGFRDVRFNRVSKGTPVFIKDAVIKSSRLPAPMRGRMRRTEEERLEEAKFRCVGSCASIGRTGVGRI